MDNIIRIYNNIACVAACVYGWVLALIAYFAPISGVLHMLMLIIAADFIFGIWAASKNHVPRTSRRLRKSIEKVFCYFGAIWLFWEVEKAIGIESYLCTYKIIAGFVALVEIISILENMAAVTEQEIFLKIIKFIRGKASEKSDVIAEIIREKNEERENKNIRL